MHLFPVFSKLKANTTRFSMDNDKEHISKVQPIKSTNIALNDQVGKLLIAAKLCLFKKTINSFFALINILNIYRIMVINRGRPFMILLATLVMPHRYNLIFLKKNDMEIEITVERQGIALLLIFWHCHNITWSGKLSYITPRINKMQ